MMPNATFISSNGERRTVAIQTGWSMMEGARAANIDGIVAECGGACACATCHVKVDAKWLEKLPPVDGAEQEMLTCTAEPAGSNSRLSCQIMMSDNLDGIEFYLPDTQV
jgi:2Fe-2S ferredoxin